MEMKRKVAKLRLSPNEEARIIREEYERRRKLRIQQVREQQRYIAQQIRREVEQRRQRELEKLGEELRADWERKQREKLDTLQKLYHESLQLLGQGHRSAKENELDLASIAEREEENHAKAVERHREALRELKSQRLKEHEKQSRSINARKKALQAEKERSAKVASLPPPPPNPIQNIDSKKPHVVKKSDVSAFAATHYHMPDSTVDREEDTGQPNAHEEAELEVRRLQDLQREERSRREEQLEKAHLRGKQALRREHLVQDRARLLVELEHMQQTDLLKRRQQVAQMPPQIFQPLYKRQETREDFQREMEFAFEDMYTGERRVKGDLVVQLVPEPLPALSTGSQDQELDITLDDIPTPGIENAQQEAVSTEQETTAQEASSKPAPRRALKKLLDRIRSQRNQWTINHHNPMVSAADSQAVGNDHIPERDTTIDTGSLTSEGKDSQPPIELLEAESSPPALESAESTSLDILHPDGLTSRIQEFEEERKKREEELEREKQQQVVLLQELEEQKAKLEQMLLEARQEREHLKAAVTQEVHINPSEAPVIQSEVQNQKFTSVTPELTTELVPPSGEDDHTSRIRAYQQRLLEQNRIHQRSVEVAHQRLEEYQRALRIRYSMTVTSFLPPGVSHPPPHSAPSVHLPAPLQLPKTPAVSASVHAKPQTSDKVPTREPEMLSSPPQLPGSSLTVGSRLLSDEVESISDIQSNQRINLTALLTNSVMERVTEHLTERERPPVTTEPLLFRPYKPFTTHHSTSVPLQQTSDPIQTTSKSIEAVAPNQPVCHVEVNPGASQQTESLSSRADDMEKRRQELQEAQRRFLEQREAVELQQRRQEDSRLRQEAEMEKMRRQKETLQALIHTNAQPVPEGAREELPSENIAQTRLKLLASLLRAIEETNGGTLSHLQEDPQDGEGSAQHPNNGQTESISQSDVSAGPAPASVLSSVLLPPPRAAKPPVTRIRLGIMEMMTEQHELSAIQEVETPVNTSHVTGLEEGLKVPLHNADWDPQEESETSLASDRSLQTPSWASRGQQTAERPTGSGVSSVRSSHLAWRERLMGAGTSPESSESDSFLRIISPLSSDSGRGADSGAAITSYRPHTQSALKTPDSDCLSSTTISTGSYITTDPEQNLNTEKAPSLRHFAGQEQGADLVSPPSGQSFCVKENSAAGRPGPAVESLFNDSSIQRIIDRYTRELNISLSTTGKTTESEGSYMEDPGPLVSQQSLVGVSERSEEDEGSAAQSPPSDAAAAPRSGLEMNDTVSPVLEHFSAEDQELDSFRPLIGQPADQSSCLAADHRESAMEQLVGHPSAHSSMIGQPPGLPFSLSLDQGGWDSTLTRMIGCLSHQSSSHWLSGGQDFYAGQLIGEMPSEQSTTWLEESQMRPLVGEPDVSAGQHSGNSAGRTRVDLGVSTEASVPSFPSLPPEASLPSAPVPGVNLRSQEQTLQNQTSPMGLSPERTAVFPDSDSFHPLLAEVTHNETADPSMTFHLPEHNVPDSPERQPASGEGSVSTPSEEFETNNDSSVESVASPERLRAEQPSSSTAAHPALHQSFSQLITSQCQPNESVLVLSPTARTDVDLTALSLSRLNMCDDLSTVGMPKPEEANVETNCTSQKNQNVVQFSDLCGELKPEQQTNLNPTSLLSHIITQAAIEKGILEESEITLASLTDTTLQDQETAFTDEEDIWEDKNPDGEREEGEEGQKGQETEGSQSTLLQEETPEDKSQKHAGMILELQWDAGESLQEACLQKRRDLLQRSNRRVEEIKAKAALAKIQPKIQVPSKAKTKSERQLKTKTNVKGGSAEQRQNIDTSCSSSQKRLQHPLPVRASRLNEVEKKLCTPEQRKRDVSAMHQRTQRLYEQLEEVKHQKAIRSRQEAYANNRLKAKEFHKKTLQKLRAKQTLQ